MLNAMRPTEVVPPNSMHHFPRPPKSIVKAVSGKRDNISNGPPTDDRSPYRSCPRPTATGPTVDAPASQFRRPSHSSARRQLHDSVDQVSNFRSRLGAVLKRLVANRDVLTLCSLFAWGRMTITIKDLQNELCELWKPKRADVIALFTHVYQNKAQYFADYPEYEFVFEDATAATVAVAHFDADVTDFHALQQELDKHWGVHKRRLCPALRKPAAVARPVSQCSVAPLPSQPNSQASSPHPPGKPAPAPTSFFKSTNVHMSHLPLPSKNGPGIPNFAVLPSGKGRFSLLPRGAGDDSPSYVSSPEAHGYGMQLEQGDDEILDDSGYPDHMLDTDMFPSRRASSETEHYGDMHADVKEEGHGQALPQFPLFGHHHDNNTTDNNIGNNNKNSSSGNNNNMFLGGRRYSAPVEAMRDHNFSHSGFAGEIKFDRRDSSVTLPETGFLNCDMSSSISLDGSVHHTPAQTPRMQSPVMTDHPMQHHPMGFPLELSGSNPFSLHTPSTNDATAGFRQNTTPGQMGANSQPSAPAYPVESAPQPPHPTLPWPLPFPLPGMDLLAMGMLPHMPPPGMLLYSQLAAAAASAPGGVAMMPPLMGALPVSMMDPVQQQAHLQQLEANLRLLQAQAATQQQQQHGGLPDTKPGLHGEDPHSAQSLHSTHSAYALTPTSLSPQHQHQQVPPHPQAPHPSAGDTVQDFAATLRTYQLDQAAMLHYQQLVAAVQVQLLQHAQATMPPHLGGLMSMPFPPFLGGFPPQMPGWPLPMPPSMPADSARILAQLQAMRDMAMAAQAQALQGAAQQQQQQGDDRPAR